MKPLNFCLRILIPCAAAVPAVVMALAPDEIQGGSIDALVAALPAPSSDRIWVKVRESISVEELSGSLKVDEERLAKLNDVDEDHSFLRGDWLVLPSQQARQIKELASIDTSDLRRSPPLHSLPPVQEGAAVRFGDTLAKIAHRYGLTLHELLRLNPGLETARLVVGSQVRLAQSAPGRTRMVLGLKPTTSGGVSWPELPGFEGLTKPFDGPSSAQGWIWPTKGVFSSGYGWRWDRMHKGIDVANNVGTPIVAAKAGRVVFSGWHDGGYGYLVTLAHADGSRSLYAHNSRLMVQVGQEVDQGFVISQMGSTGRSTGPHLHFEIHPASSGAVNPLQMLPPRA
ncbi:MAG: M23 family metallopeptidase [Cyanobacteria bacterium]|nr:M23 family metallopeptidase [Cyanobacteria bacterium bin.275]